MQKYSLKDLIECDGSKFNSKILINEPGCQMALFNISAGQSAPEYATKGLVTVGALRGHVTVHVGSTSCELHAGEVVSIEAGALHRVEAHEDSALLSLTTGNSNAEIDLSEELDLREIPRPERHPLIFAKFDTLIKSQVSRIFSKKIGAIVLSAKMMGAIVCKEKIDRGRGEGDGQMFSKFTYEFLRAFNVFECS